MTLQSHAEQCGNLKTNAVTIWAVTTMAQWLGFWPRPSQLIKESFVNKSYCAIIIIIIIVSLYLSIFFFRTVALFSLVTHASV